MSTADPRRSMSAVFDVLQRLAIPFVLLAAFIAASVALGRVGNESLPPASDESLVAASPVTPVLSIRRAPEILTSPRANEELIAELSTWVNQLPENSCFVVSAGGEPIFEHNPTLPLRPASNLKILTAVAALDLLGPDTTFTTGLYARQAPDENGLLEGDLYVLGGGDPVLATDAYAAVLPEGFSEIRTRADELADLAVAQNLSNITGSVLVDESRYDDQRAVDGWPPRFLDQGQIGSLGAALLDDGFLGLADGYSARSEDPFTPLPRSANPAEQFAANFDDLLEARNVVINSRAGVSLETPFDELIELTSVESPPMRDIVTQMLTNSDNTTAEMLVKELGFTRQSETGSTIAGTIAIADWLPSAGLENAGLFVVDGSGLSPEDQATCSHIHGALSIEEHRDTMRDAMPIAGESGTLVDDFSGTSFDGRLRAKTGFLADVSSLSGYFITDPGVELTFSLIINVDDGTEITEDQIAAWQADLPDILASYPAGPPLEQLGPVGAAEAAAEAAANEVEAPVEEDDAVADEDAPAAEDGDAEDGEAEDAEAEDGDPADEEPPTEDDG